MTTKSAPEAAPSVSPRSPLMASRGDDVVPQAPLAVGLGVRDAEPLLLRQAPDALLAHGDAATARAQTHAVRPGLGDPGPPQQAVGAAAGLDAVAQRDARPELEHSNPAGAHEAQELGD